MLDPSALLSPWCKIVTLHLTPLSCRCLSGHLIVAEQMNRDHDPILLHSSSLGEHPKSQYIGLSRACHPSPTTSCIQVMVPNCPCHLVSNVHPFRAFLLHVSLTAIQTRVSSQLSVIIKCLMVSESWEFSSFKDLSNFQRTHSRWVEFRLVREKEKKRDTIIKGFYYRTLWYTMVEWGYYDKEGGYVIENMVLYDREGLYYREMLYDRGSMAEML